MDVDHVPDDSHFVSIADVGGLNQMRESREDQKVVVAQKHKESTEGCDIGTRVQSDSIIGHGEFVWQHTLAVISKGSTGHGLSQGASCGEPETRERVDALLESELKPTGNGALCFYEASVQKRVEEVEETFEKLGMLGGVHPSMITRKQSNQFHARTKLSAPDLMQVMYGIDDPSLLWSITTERVQYPADLTDSEGVKVLPRRFAAHHHILHLKAFEQSADVPVDETGYCYFSAHNQIQPFFLPNESVSATLLHSGPCLSDAPDEHCLFSMNAEAKVTVTVFNHDFPINVLLDSGATKMLINERWMNEFDKIHKLPRYRIPSRYVRIGNGQKHHITHAAKVTIVFERKPIEIIALIMPGMDDPLDLVIGSKSLFELEASLNYQRVQVEIHDHTIPLATMEKTVLHAHEETLLPITMEGIPLHWTESLAIAKLFFPQLMQHCVNYLTTQVHCDVQGHAVLALRNDTSESITLPKHTRVGVLDLRSVGYFHKS